MPSEGTLEAHEGPRSQAGGGLRASWEGEEGHGETMWWFHRSSSPAGNYHPSYFLKKTFLMRPCISTIGSNHPSVGRPVCHFIGWGLSF